MADAGVFFRVRERRCALPVACVVESMRPLPIEPIAGAPPFVLGAAVVRGRATPVVDLGALLDGEPLGPGGRWLTLRAAEGRTVALAASAVERVAPLPDDGELPALFADAPADRIERLLRLDGALLTVLRAGRLVPDELWRRLEGGTAP